MLKSKQNQGQWREEIFCETWSHEGDAAITWNPIDRKRKKGTNTEHFSLLIVWSPQYFSLTEFTLKSEEKGPENVSPSNTQQGKEGWGSDLYIQLISSF